MSFSRERRNGGRVLAVVIESGDNRSRTGLKALSGVTRQTFQERGFDVSRWPADVRMVLAGEGAAARVVRFDAFNEEHVFALADCGQFDVLLGVSSRREMNVPGVRSGNLATNVILDFLSYPDQVDPSRPRYGEVGAENLSRLWRNEVGAAHVQNFAREWDLVLWSVRDHLDYLVPGTHSVGLLKGSESAENATNIVVNGAKHKSAAHREGILKYAKGQTHPLVRVNPVTRQILGYNEPAVAAFREAVRLLRTGASWEEAAAAVGDRIPAPQAQQEPDDDPDGDTTRTRAARNTMRVAKGLPPLALRFLPDGSPNPDYRPENILDLNRPAERLRTLLLWGPSVPRRHAETIQQRVNTDLDGISPDDCFHVFYTTGVYRRLVKNQTLSNSSEARYQWQPLALGPTSDGEPVLTEADIEFLRTFRTGRTGTGSWGNNPLTGVFRVEQQTPLFTRNGYLDPARGNFRVRSGSTGDDRGVRIWFEPLGADPHSKDCCAIGWAPNSEIGPTIARMIVEALQSGQEAAAFRFHHEALRRDPVVEAKQTVADIERRHQAAAVRLVDPDLSELTVNALKRELTAIEAELHDARTALLEAQAQPERTPASHNDRFDITDLAQLAAVVGSATPLPTAVAERAARLLRTFLQEPRFIIEPATATIRIEARLTLPSEHGVLSIPMQGRVHNRSLDPWVAGPAGMWWERRNAPLKDVMTEQGLASAASARTRWSQPIAQRLLTQAAERGQPLRGEELAGLIVRCDEPEVLAEIRDAIEFGTSCPRLHAFLFDGPDVRKKAWWRTDGFKR